MAVQRLEAVCAAVDLTYAAGLPQAEELPSVLMVTHFSAIKYIYY